MRLSNAFGERRTIVAEIPLNRLAHYLCAAPYPEIHGVDVGHHTYPPNDRERKFTKLASARWGLLSLIFAGVILGSFRLTRISLILGSFRLTRISRPESLRMGAACDWGTGLPLKAGLLGKMSRLEVHHIFPKSRLYAAEPAYRRPEVNALGNFCFLTRDTNLEISNRLPQDYFPEIEKAHPGALASQWIPMDERLWRIENFRGFLDERKRLLADELNVRLKELLHGETQWLQDTSRIEPALAIEADGVTSEAEEHQLEALNDWVAAQLLPRGVLNYELEIHPDDEVGTLCDLAWPQGLQENLSQPVAMLLKRPANVLAAVSQAGFLCFTGVDALKAYVTNKIIAAQQETSADAALAV
jgi:hypothetical protein